MATISETELRIRILKTELHKAHSLLMELREQEWRQNKILSDYMNKYQHYKEWWIINNGGRLWLCGDVGDGKAQLLERLMPDEYQALMTLYQPDADDINVGNIWQFKTFSVSYYLSNESPANAE